MFRYALALQKGLFPLKSIIGLHNPRLVGIFDDSIRYFSKFRKNPKKIEVKMDVSPLKPRPAPGVSKKRKAKRTQRMLQIARSEAPIGEPGMTIEEYVKTIDTTLTPEQRAHVEMIKKKVKGSFRSPRSTYRDVPRPDEMESDGLLVANLAENAEELVDYAYSHIPKRAGPRNSRLKKRLMLRDEVTRFQSAKRRDQHRDKLKRDAEKKAQKDAMIKVFKAQAADLRAQHEAKLQAIRDRLGFVKPQASS